MSKHAADNDVAEAFSRLSTASMRSAGMAFATLLQATAGVLAHGFSTHGCLGYLQARREPNRRLPFMAYTGLYVILLRDVCRAFRAWLRCSGAGPMLPTCANPYSGARLARTSDLASSRQRPDMAASFAELLTGVSTVVFTRLGQV